MRGARLRLLLAVIAASGVACSLGGEPVTSTVLGVDCEQFEAAAQAGAPVTDQVAIAPGQHLEVVLCSNPSTGFAWDDPSWEGDPNLELVTRGTAAQVDAAPGAPIQESFTFKAVAPGTTVIHFTYSQPWAGGTKGAWRFDLTVTVE